MSFLQALWELVADVFSLFWLSVLDPKVNEPDDPVLEQAAADTRASQPETMAARNLMERREAVMVIANTPPQSGERPAIPKEGLVSDGSFLSQLEQRTQQVKITLANLEAEKARIEALIGRLQPLVPHYDALLDAERSIEEAHISLETAAPAASPEDSWSGQQHGWNG